MTIADRWLLPDGVEEILPDQARCVEELRRSMLDLFHVWGYELVIPPMVEYTESLLIGFGHDLDLHSFKVIDQLSGRLMAIRPDITPQTARIDAHSMRREGPVRLCYAGSVLHTVPKSQQATRSPIQLGAELYGEASASADIEIISLMLETLKVAGASDVVVDLGHVGIFGALASAAGLSEQVEQELFEALQRKARGDIQSLVASAVEDATLRALFVELAQLHGDAQVLDKARALFNNSGVDISDALDRLAEVANEISRRYPQAECYFDLAELRGYHYHTGLVFAAYTPGRGHAIANGGRYDDIGEAFGRARPATGFSTELKTLVSIAAIENVNAGAIFAPHSDDLDLWNAVQTLRADGEVVIFGHGDKPLPTACERQLVLHDGEWRLEAIK